MKLWRNDSSKFGKMLENLLIMSKSLTGITGFRHSPFPKCLMVSLHTLMGMCHRGSGRLHQFFSSFQFCLWGIKCYLYLDIILLNFHNQGTLTQLLLLLLLLLFLLSLILGCLYNIKDSLPAGCQAQTIQVMTKVISETLDKDAANRMATLLPQIQTNGTTVSR